MVSGGLLGETYNFTGAVSQLTRALEIAKETGDTVREGRIWNNLGVCHLDAAQYADALAMFEKALDFGDADLKNMATQNIALVALQVKDIPKGIAAAKAAIAASHEPKTAHECLLRVQTELTFTRLLLEVDQIDAAEMHSRTAREIAAKSGSSQAKVLASLCEALTDICRGRTDLGVTRLKRTIEEARRGSPAAFRFVLMAGVEGYKKAGEPDVAIVLLKELVELNKRTKGAGLLHHLRRELRDVDLALDDMASAALVEQETALLVGQGDPAPRERDSDCSSAPRSVPNYTTTRPASMFSEWEQCRGSWAGHLACRRTRARSWTTQRACTISARSVCRKAC